MCGRVDIHTPPAQLARILDAALAAGVDPEGRPSWNVAPSRSVPVVLDTPGDDNPSGERTRMLDVFRWGLVPHWAKDPKVGYKMINARSETAATSSAYRTALSRRRCLIVVDGFYEWMAPDPSQPKRKVPFYFRRTDGEPITFAALYEIWWDKKRSPEPDPETFLQTCVIMTTSAGPDMIPVHDRMPVIVEPANRDRWLDPGITEPHAVSALLVPSAPRTLLRFPVSSTVNSPKNDGPELITPETDPAVLDLVAPTRA
ncbi:MAG: SOS response-associated peptidase [Acidimicrobiales bacterium]